MAAISKEHTDAKMAEVVVRDYQHTSAQFPRIYIAASTWANLLKALCGNGSDFKGNFNK